MNLYSTVQAAYGGRLKQAGLVRRRRSIKDAQALGYFFQSYADETTKANYIDPADIGAPSEEAYLSAVLSRGAPLRPEIDYIPFRSRVLAFGRAARSDIYFSHEIEKMPDRERMMKLWRWWDQNTAGQSTKAHHLVFSLDPRLTAAMTEVGTSVDSFLLTAVSNAFAAFQSRFYPGDTLGYLAALHHDRAHVHAHVLVHPLSQNGAQVNLSILRRYRVGDRMVNVPCQQVLKDAFERETEAACKLFVPQAPEEEDVAGKRRAEAAEELMLLTRAKRHLSVKQEGAIDRQTLTQVRNELLARDDYIALVRQGRDAAVHLILKDLADGRLFELRHNFPALAGKAAKAGFETTSQERAILAMFAAHLTENSTAYLEGVGTPIMRQVANSRADSRSPALSFRDEERERRRHFQKAAEANDRVRQETAVLRASILHEDKTATECVIAASNTALQIMHALSPTLGEGPDFLTLWTPSPDGRPRLARPDAESAKLGKCLDEAAAALSAQHQPVNLTEFASSEIAADSEGQTGEIHPYRIVSAPPGFLAKPHEVKWDDPLTLIPPPRRRKGPEPTPG